MLAEQERWRNFRRKARALGVYDEHVDSLIVMERDDGVCGICGEDVDPLDYTLDHRVPFARGGRHNYANVQLAHHACNSRKSAKGSGELLAQTPAARRRARVLARDGQMDALLRMDMTIGDVAGALGVSAKTISVRIAERRRNGEEIPTRKQGYRKDPSNNGRKKA
jgi:hypothetical protein